jgi:hypothetical protein
MLIKGSDLTSGQRQLVLGAYVHRHTVENARARGVPCVMCATSSGPADRIIVIPAGQRAAGEVRTTWHEHHVRVQTDEAWLADHAFHFTKDGRRLMIRRHAEPVWKANEQPGKGGTRGAR